MPLGQLNTYCSWFVGVRCLKYLWGSGPQCPFHIWPVCVLPPFQISTTSPLAGWDATRHLWVGNFLWSHMFCKEVLTDMAVTILYFGDILAPLKSMRILFWTLTEPGFNPGYFNILPLLWFFWNLLFPLFIFPLPRRGWEVAPFNSPSKLLINITRQDAGPNKWSEVLGHTLN